MCNFYSPPPDHIITFVVLKRKVWKFEMLSILIQFLTFHGEHTIPRSKCHYRLCLTLNERERESVCSVLSRGSLVGVWQSSAKFWHLCLAKHPGRMSDSYGKSIAPRKDALIWILAPLSACEITLMEGLEYWQNIFKTLHYIYWLKI